MQQKTKLVFGCVIAVLAVLLVFKYGESPTALTLAKKNVSFAAVNALDTTGFIAYWPPPSYCNGGWDSAGKWIQVSTDSDAVPKTWRGSRYLLFNRNLGEVLVIDTAQSLALKISGFSYQGLPITDVSWENDNVISVSRLATREGGCIVNCDLVTRKVVKVDILSCLSLAQRSISFIATTAPDTTGFETRLEDCRSGDRTVWFHRLKQEVLILDSTKPEALKIEGLAAFGIPINVKWESDTVCMIWIMQTSAHYFGIYCDLNQKKVIKVTGAVGQ